MSAPLPLEDQPTRILEARFPPAPVPLQINAAKHRYEYQAKHRAPEPHAVGETNRIIPLEVWQAVAMPLPPHSPGVAPVPATITRLSGPRRILGVALRSLRPGR